jgi:FIMAH domain-containing protein
MTRRILRAGAMALLALVGAASIGSRHASADGQPAGATPAAAPVLPVDADHDGINDDLEQRLAERYAPVIYIEPDESNYPVNVDWFLERARLQYHEDCADDVDSNRGPFPIGTQLLGPNAGALWAGGPNCGEDDMGYSHPPHRLLTTVATDPDGQFSVGALTTGYSDQQTFVLTDLDPLFHVGSTDPRDWRTYFHVYPADDGGVMIQYWHVFAFNAFGGGFDDHGGDWDASIQVWLTSDLTLRGVWFSRHADDHPGTFFCASADAGCGDPRVRLFDSTHPVVTIDGGGHAAFRSPSDWATCDCRVLEGVTGPLGTIVWTEDTDAFDNPAALRRAEFVCAPNGGCSLTLSAPSGGIVWKTWTDGDVVASGSLTNPILSPSAHGGLVNLGEYNPCTPATCFGTAQGSQLLAGEFHPLNNAFWLRYEGRWGSIGTINSGPRGPVFQGFEDRGSLQVSFYRAWLNNGASSPATNDGTHPWLVPPPTSATLDGASHTTGAVTFVSGTTRVALSASQSAIADRFGSPVTWYRIHPVGGSLPEFTQYSGAFTLVSPLGSPDGAYNVDYFTVDGLGNVEDAKTLSVTLDTTAPLASINQPTATNYPHSATLTLSYSVDDGSGSGVSSFTPTLDGAATLPDGKGLASGQAIPLLTELSIGRHTFAIDSVDNVGNRGSRSVVFSIVVTADSIKDDVSQFLDADKIRNGGLAKSLLGTLNPAAAARSRGECATASNQYGAFIRELEAQAGNGVDAVAAAIMIADAQYLIANCP